MIKVSFQIEILLIGSFMLLEHCGEPPEKSQVSLPTLRTIPLCFRRWQYYYVKEV